ncbi:amino acid transporter, putative [Plasmodium ovale curtisi]|uniref:Amino acid transporter, putative n=1 Tax=Plasmodium ovale curtisi TaxID=864141 RepID=A0A1A8W5Y1_PLAOA|nr:amino acid transporter, putative [Plasmodium ovale curtisi]SBS96984.1 amino acid transporter, putative [Plasmodium ovale curtisi]
MGKRSKREVSWKKVSRKEVSGKELSKKKVSEKKVSEKKVSEKKVREKKVRGKKVSGEKVSRKKVSGEKVSEGYGVYKKKCTEMCKCGEIRKWQNKTKEINLKASAMLHVKSEFFLVLLGVTQNHEMVSH